MIMINYIDKIRILAVMMVFFLHSFIFVGKDFPMSDIIKESSLCMIFSCRHGRECGYFLLFPDIWQG